MSGFTITTPSHKLTAFQIDGGNDIENPGPSSAIGVLYPGERIDMIIDWSKSSGADSIFSIALDEE